MQRRHIYLYQQGVQITFFFRQLNSFCKFKKDIVDVVEVVICKGCCQPLEPQSPQHTFPQKAEANKEINKRTSKISNIKLIINSIQNIKCQDILGTTVDSNLAVFLKMEILEISLRFILQKIVNLRLLA